MSGNGSENSNTRDAAEQYLRAGLMVIPIPAGEKNPNRPGWQNERLTVDDVSKHWTNGQGVGVLWGEPSGGLVDVDLDWPEARIAAERIMPTTRTFGRPGATESHRVYRATGTIPKTKRYKIGGDGEDRSVVEVLSTGTQSLVPPSLHGSGERREWYRDEPAAEIDGAALLEGVSDVATAALIARNWPGRGARKDYVMAAAGYVGRHLPRERAERVMEAAIAISGDEEAASRSRDVRDTLVNLEDGGAVTGGPTLDAIAPGVVNQLRRWHVWSTERDRRLTYGRQEPDSFNLTDLGNALRLVARHGNDLRYCHPWGRWLVWDGRRWKVDDSGEVERRAVETVSAIYSEAAHAADADERKALARHAERSEARSRIDAMIALAKSRPGIPVAPDELDRDPLAFNVLNGTLDLESRELREHRRADMITKMAGTRYEPDARAPRFARFLREIFDGDEAIIAFVRRLAGYSLTGSTEDRVFAILHGRGRNGKTTLVELLQAAMADYATTTDTETILAKRYQGVGNDVAALRGARFVAAAEVEQGRALAESKIKALTGSDTVTARFLYAEPFTFRPTFKLWLSTNNRPVIRGDDDAIWDRIRLIPFARRFEGTEADPKLPAKLRNELPGVLAWAVTGCAEWQRDGLGEPEKVAAATEGYRAEQDTLAGWIEEECVARPDAWCKFADLYASYVRWCEGAHEHPDKKRRFADRLTERGYVADKGAKNVAIRRGIALRFDDDPDPVGVTDPPLKSGPEPPDSGDGGVVNGNWVTDQPDNGNPQNSHKTSISDEGVTEGYRKSNNFGPYSRVGESFEKTVTLGNSVTREGESTPRGGASEARRLTADEAARVQRLVAEGMSPSWARAEVLGKELEAG